MQLRCLEALSMVLVHPGSSHEGWFLKVGVDGPHALQLYPPQPHRDGHYRTTQGDGSRLPSCRWLYMGPQQGPGSLSSLSHQ